MRSIVKASVAICVIAGISPAVGQGSAGTGSTSTGIGPQTGPAGPGIRRGGWTQQPGQATNTTTAETGNLSPAQKNSIAPLNARVNAKRVPK